MKTDIERDARLIEATAASIDGRTWAQEVLTRCRMMREAIDRMEKKATESLGGER